MRLDILTHGQRLRNRIIFRAARALAGIEMDDVIKTSMYRPGIFGRAWIPLVRHVMRGPSDWSPGERELFAAFTSRLNTCRFCLGEHLGVAALTLDPAIHVEQLDHWRDAGFEPRVKAMLGLLEKTTQAPDDVGPGDIASVRAAGISDAAIVDALHVCFVFNLINRVANALDFDFGTDASRQKSAAILNRMGYNVPGFLLR